MDIATLKAQLEAGRALAPVVEGATFKLKVPNDHDWRVALQANMNDEGRVQEAAAFRAILTRAIVGWEGVTAAHFGAEGTEPIAFSEHVCAVLLGERPDLAQALILEIAKHRAARRTRREGEQKN